MADFEPELDQTNRRQVEMEVAEAVGSLAEAAQTNWDRLHVYGRSRGRAIIDRIKRARPTAR